MQGHKKQFSVPVPSGSLSWHQSSWNWWIPSSASSYLLCHPHQYSPTYWRPCISIWCNLVHGDMYWLLCRWAKIFEWKNGSLGNYGSFLAIFGQENLQEFKVVVCVDSELGLFCFCVFCNLWSSLRTHFWWYDFLSGKRNGKSCWEWADFTWICVLWFWRYFGEAVVVYGYEMGWFAQCLFQSLNHMWWQCLTTEPKCWVGQIWLGIPWWASKDVGQDDKWLCVKARLCLQLHQTRPNKGIGSDP